VYLVVSCTKTKTEISNSLGTKEGGLVSYPVFCGEAMCDHAGKKKE